MVRGALGGSRRSRRLAVAVAAAVLMLVVSVAVNVPPAARSSAAAPPPSPSSGKPIDEMVTAPKPPVPDTSGLPEQPSRPNAAPLSAAAAPSTPDAPLNDLDRAKLEAKASGEPVVVESLKTETTTTSVNPDGSYTTTLAAGPVRVATPEGWVPVDPTLVADGSGVHPKATPAGVELSGGGRGPLVSAVVPPPPSSTPGRPARPAVAAPQVAVGAPGRLPRPVLFGDTATYRDVVAGGDVVVETTTTGFEVSVVFHQAPTRAPVIELPVDFEGLHLEQAPNGDLRFLDGSGKTVAFAPAPVMFDATEAPAGQHPRTVKVPTTIKTVGDRQVLELRPDPGFFTDPATVYPVTVDPAATLFPAADTYVNSSTPNTSHDSAQTLFTGPGGLLFNAHTFVAFDDGFIKDPRRHVQSATLKMYEHIAGSCVPTQINVMGSAPLGPGATWNTQPALDGHVWASASITGDDTACPGQVGYKSFDVTGLVQQWAGDPSTTTDTLALVSQNTTDPNGWKGFYSGETIGPPQLVINYLMQPDQATNLNPASGLVETLAPTLSATVGGGDGGGYAVEFTVTDTDTNTEVASHAVLAGPGKVQYTVPEGKLSVGGHYVWSVTNCEGFFPQYCAPPATATFQVDPALAAGDRAYFTYNTHSLGDRSTLKVNVASGNLVVENTDLHINGTGLDLNLARTYNSATTQAGVMGSHWTMTRTPTVRLVANPDGSFTYYDEFGTTSLITQDPDGSYNVSGDLDASFIDAGGFGVYRLRFHHDRGTHRAGDVEYFWNNWNNTVPGRKGLPQGAVDRNNNSIGYTYSGTRVTGVVDTQSRPVTYHYGPAGRIDTVTDPNSVGRSLGYHYDSAGNLDRFTDANANVTTYQYDGDHNLTRITGPGGHVTTVGYDGQHRVTSLTTTVGGVDETTTFAYTTTPGPTSDQTVVTDRNGHTTTYSYDGTKRVSKAVDALGQVAEISYDVNGNVTSVTDSANSPPYLNSYMPNNNPTSSGLPTGATQHWGMRTRTRTTRSAPTRPPRRLTPKATAPPPPTTTEATRRVPPTPYPPRTLAAWPAKATGAPTAAPTLDRCVPPLTPGATPPPTPTTPTATSPGSPRPRPSDMSPSPTTPSAGQ